MSGWVFLGLTSTKQQIKCLAQEHNTASSPAVRSGSFVIMLSCKLCLIVMVTNIDSQLDKIRSILSLRHRAGENFQSPRQCPMGGVP